VPGCSKVFAANKSFWFPATMITLDAIFNNYYSLRSKRFFGSFCALKAFYSLPFLLLVICCHPNFCVAKKQNRTYGKTKETLRTQVSVSLVIYAGVNVSHHPPLPRKLQGEEWGKSEISFKYWQIPLTLRCHLPTEAVSAPHTWDFPFWHHYCITRFQNEE